MTEAPRKPNPHEQPRQPTEPRPVTEPTSSPHAEAATRADVARVVTASQAPARLNDVAQAPLFPPRTSHNPIDVITEPDIKEGHVLPPRPTQLEQAPAEPATVPGEYRSPIAEVSHEAEPPPATALDRAVSIIYEPTNPDQTTTGNRPEFTTATTIDTTPAEAQTHEARHPDPVPVVPLPTRTDPQSPDRSVAHDAPHVSSTVESTEPATAPDPTPLPELTRGDLELRVDRPEGETPPSLSDEIRRLVTQEGQPINLMVETPDGPMQIGTAALATVSTADGKFHAQIVAQQTNDHVDPAHVQGEQINPEDIQQGRNTVHILWMDTETNEVGLEAWVGNQDASNKLSIVYHLNDPTPKEAELSVAERLKDAVAETLSPEREASLATRLSEATSTYLDSADVASTMTTLPRSLPAFLDPSTRPPAPEKTEKPEPGLTTEWVGADGVAQPVTVTQYLGKDRDGRKYVGVAESTTGIPLDQIHASDPQAFKEMVQEWVDAATTRPQPEQARPSETPVYTAPTARPTQDERTLTQMPAAHQNFGGGSSGERRTAQQQQGDEQRHSGRQPDQRDQRTQTGLRPRPAAIDYYVKPRGGVAVEVVKVTGGILGALIKAFLEKPQVVKYNVDEKSGKVRVLIRTNRGKFRKTTVRLRDGETIQQAVNRQRLKNIFRKIID